MSKLSKKLPKKLRLRRKEKMFTLKNNPKMCTKPLNINRK